MRPHALPGVLKNIRRLKMKVLVAIFALVALTNGLKVKLNNRQCGPDETSCPTGCCPEANWFCCPDNMYCAATAADCPFVAKKAQLMKMAKTGSADPMRPHAPLAAALRPTGSAALTTCTVLPLLLTAPSELLAIICQSLQN